MVARSFENVANKLEEWVSPVKDFLFANHGNPIMWIIIFCAGLALFVFTYGVLHRD